jgi:hypothetical protein
VAIGSWIRSGYGCVIDRDGVLEGISISSDHLVVVVIGIGYSFDSDCGFDFRGDLLDGGQEGNANGYSYEEAAYPYPPAEAALQQRADSWTCVSISINQCVGGSSKIAATMTMLKNEKSAWNALMRVVAKDHRQHENKNYRATVRNRRFFQLPAVLGF